MLHIEGAGRLSHFALHLKILTPEQILQKLTAALA